MRGLFTYMKGVWLRWLKPILDAWGYLTDAHGLVKVLLFVALLLLPGGSLLAMIGAVGTFLWGPLSSVWLVLILGLGFALLTGPYVVLWRRRARRIKTAEPAAVDYAGIRWVHTGGFYWGSGEPISHPQCPEHRVRLFYKERSREGTRDPRSDDLIGQYWGEFLCVAGGSHTIAIPADFERRTFGNVQREAEALLEARLGQSRSAEAATN